jgi:hypothetical protein
MSIGLSKRTPIRGFIITLIAMVPVLVARPAAAAPPSVSADRAGQLERNRQILWIAGEGMITRRPW